MIQRLNGKKLPEEFGFFNGIGAHSSRTIMYNEISIILNSTNPDISLEELKNKIYDDNLLHKESVSGRKKTFSFLKKTYGLDPDLPLYHAFRWAWSSSEPNERPTIAILFALCRDSVLRLSANYILSIPIGVVVNKKILPYEIEKAYPGTFSEKVITSMWQNLLSSWHQSGHLDGVVTKTRKKAHANAASCVFALYIGYITGLRGRYLFDSLWMHVLDATDREIQEYVHLAAKRGWIKYRESGGMIEITFSTEIFRGVDSQ